MAQIKAAMVLAAGLGTRMRPLSQLRPKPLIELAGRPLVDHVLDRLGEAGTEQAVVNLHHKADRLQAHLTARKRPRIVFSDERCALLDTGGGVCKALPLLGEESFFIHNSDSVWIEGAQPALERMAARWDPAAMDSLLLLAPTQGSLGYTGRGDFEMDAGGRLTRRSGTVTAPFVFAGVSIAHRRLFTECPEGPFSLNLLWDRAIGRGRLLGIRHNGVWMHVGTPEALLQAEERLKRDSR